MQRIVSRVLNGHLFLPREAAQQWGVSEADQIELVIDGDRLIARKIELSSQPTFALEDIVAETYSSPEMAP